MTRQALHGASQGHRVARQGFDILASRYDVLSHLEDVASQALAKIVELSIVLANRCELSRSVSMIMVYPVHAWREGNRITLNACNATSPAWRAPRTRSTI